MVGGGLARDKRNELIGLLAAHFTRRGGASSAG
jgi:hypothetical protein